MTMESIVNTCLKHHEGGERFFNSIDEKLRNDNLLMIMMLAKIMGKEKFDYLIVSERFGYAFKEFCQKSIDNNFSNNIITVNGGLRSGNITTNLNINISNKNLIFIDDSFYAGRTRDKIKEYINKNGGNLIGTYVFYDGSKEKDDNVYSFYRYYDNFK